MNREFLKDLLSTPSVSGYEEAIQQKALAYGKAFARGAVYNPAFNVIYLYIIIQRGIKGYGVNHKYVGGRAFD